MSLAILVRQAALLMVVALCPALAFALSETYEGVLLPNNGRDAPIPIVIQLEDLGGVLTGRVKTSSPLNGNSAIESGQNVAGSCNLTTVLSSSVTLHLSGSCNPTTFEGKYNIRHTPGRAVTLGTFRLISKVLETDKRTTKGTAPVSTGPVSTSVVTACLKANTHCLNACPRGDAGAEYLCANRCRSKLQACKGKAARDLTADE